MRFPALELLAGVGDVPAMRDRDSGIWQPVTLTVTQQVKMGAPQVVTTFKNDDTTQAQDSALFLDNAADTIRHFRNHPSIVLWSSRNEGVPQPIINMGLDCIGSTLDGTRFYSSSSNQINLQ